MWGKPVIAAAVCLVISVLPNADAQPEASNGQLRICTTGDYLPLTYRDPEDGSYRGIDIDMARDLAADLGRDPVFVPTTWSTLVADIQAPGKCDIAMGGISATPVREKVADFTASYLTNGKVPLVRAVDIDRYQSITQIDQPDVRVIENNGGTNEQFARERLPNATLTIWPDNTTIFDQLIAGNADVMITDAIEARYRSVQHPELAAVNPDEPFTNDRKVYLLPRGNLLTGVVDTWLKNALTDGTFDRFYRQWMG
jgi:cyclohexadienyl dehydratase